jgi:nitrogen fixation NifU-like protein
VDKKYSNEVMDHFLNPRNVGKIKNPSGRGRIGNAVCGDVMEMTLKIEIQNPKSKISNKSKAQKSKRPKKLKSYNLQPIITDAKFLTFGCGAAVATSSIVTELVKGKTIEEAKKLTPLSIDKSLGNLPMMKKHCARLAIDALKKAINDFEKNGG